MLKLLLPILLIISPEGPEKTTSLRPPLDIELSLSANFGELRSGHFHSGVDFKTRGETGHRVIASADGYVYRISVSPGGFGKALYIRHSNGLSTVYGHLSRFNEEIDSYVKNLQYDRKSFSVNLFPDKGRFRFKQGELIAFSGNTGSSQGPHLHFEVRKTIGEKPVDPVSFFDIADNIKPVIKTVIVYPIGQNSRINGKQNKLIRQVSGSSGVYKLRDRSMIRVSGPVGFGIHSYDYFNGSWNKCGVRIINLKVNNRLIYSHAIDEFSFSETRYINSHIDYEAKLVDKISVQKTFIEPNNKLSIYNHAAGRGIVNLTRPGEHSVSMVVADFNNNVSSVDFRIVIEDTLYSNSPAKEGIILPYDRENNFQSDGVSVTFPKGCFYDTLNFTYNYIPDDNGNYFSGIHKIHNKLTPVHKSYELSIELRDIPDESYRDKLCLVYLNGEEDSDPVYAGGELKGNVVEGKVSNLGSYTIGIDTIAPLVKPSRYSSGSLIPDKGVLRFRLKDDFSGIKSYRGEIDGSWALFEWDPKSGYLSYIPDPERIKRNTSHTLKLTVSDNRGNSTVLIYKFEW